VYGYCTGVFSSRKIERATFESLPFRFIARDWHPDHDTLANFRQSFLKEIKALFIEVVLLAQAFGVLYRRPAYDVCSTGDRNHQRGTGVPTVLAAGIGRSCGRRVSGVSGIQCQALA
jgi:Transposase domain (DUF772)